MSDWLGNMKHKKTNSFELASATIPATRSHSGPNQRTVEASLSGFLEGLESNEATLNVPLFEAIHQSFLDDPKQCVSWGDQCLGFLSKIWRHLTYALLNKGNRLIQATTRLCIAALVRAAYPYEVADFDPR